MILQMNAATAEMSCSTWQLTASAMTKQSTAFLSRIYKSVCLGSEPQPPNNVAYVVQSTHADHLKSTAPLLTHAFARTVCFFN